MLERFHDPPQRARIVKETETAMDARFGGANGVYLPAIRRELMDIAREQQVSPGEAVVRLLEQRNETGIMRFGSEADLVRILKYPAASIACDCGATLNTRQHPRAWGSFPRLLGRYVREQRVLTWEAAIRKMTALPANTIGMIDRGFIAPGMAADVTVFDPHPVIDRATYDDPAQLSEGIRTVIVNGVVALRDGKPTSERGGRVLVRSAHMPGRPMNSVTTRRFAARGTMPDRRRVTIDLTQAAGAARATGAFRLLDAHGSTLLDASDLGVLQTAKDWASITGMARSQPGGAPRPFTAVFERADPFVAGTPRTLSVEVPGQPAVTGVLK